MSVLDNINSIALEQKKIKKNIKSITETLSSQTNNTDFDDLGKMVGRIGNSTILNRIQLQVNDYIATNGYVVNNTTMSYSEILNYFVDKNTEKHHGKLHKNGNLIYNQNNEPVYLQGIALFHGQNLVNKLHTYESLKTLKLYGFNMVRLMAYATSITSSTTDTYDPTSLGYDTDSVRYKSAFDTIIEWCKELGLYVIVDFHILMQNVNNYLVSASEFFTYFSTKYADCNNIIYELANEPYSNTASSMLNYIVTLYNIIKQNNPDAIIVTGRGSDGISSHDSVSAMNQVLINNNLDMFISDHTYTGTYDSTNDFNSNAQNFPFFCTEWGNAGASGQGEINNVVTSSLIDTFYANKTANCIFQFSPVQATCSLLKYDTNKNDLYKYGGFTLYDDISESGQVVFDKTFENKYLK